MDFAARVGRTNYFDEFGPMEGVESFAEVEAKNAQCNAVFQGECDILFWA